MPLQSAYRALSDPTRREILWLLRDGPLRVDDVIARLDQPVVTVTRHLGLLTAAGLVQASGDIYAAKNGVLADIVLELAELAGIGTDVSRADLIEPWEAERA